MLKNIPELLNQPTGIAALASVGIHGAIALIVPLMPVNSSQSTAANTKKAVGLIEFSPEDLARLPQTSDNPQTALQPLQLPQQPQTQLPNLNSDVTVIPPLQTPLANQAVLPIVPKSTNSYNLSYLPRQQAAPMFSQRDFRTQVSNFRIGSNLPRSIPRVAPRSESPFVDDIDTQIRETQPLNVSRLPQVQANNGISGEPLVNPSADAIDIGSTRTTEEVTEFTHPNLANNSTEVTEGGSAGFLAGESMERRSKLISVAPTVTPSPEGYNQGQVVVPTMSRSEAQIQKNQRLLATIKSTENSRKAVEIEQPIIKQQTVIRKTIATDSPEMEGTVSGELVVDANGKVLDIKFQGGRVSPQLKSQTTAFLSANAPKGEKQVSYYPFQLQFKNVNNGSMSGKNNQNVQPVANEQDRKNPTKNQAVVIPNPSPASGVVEEKSSVNNNSSPTLIQKLRQIKEDRQTSNQDQ